MGYALSLNAEFERAKHHLEKSLDLHVQSNNLAWIAVAEGLTSYLVYYPNGKINLAYKTSLDAIHIAEQSADIYPKVFGYSCHGVSCYARGLLDEARDHLLKGIDLNEKLNQFYWRVGGNQFVAEVYYQLGEYESAVSHYKKVIGLLEDKGVMQSTLDLNKIALARAKTKTSERVVDIESLYSYVSKNKVKAYEGRMNKYICEMLLNTDDQHISEAENWIIKAIEADKRNDMMWHLAMDYALYAELFKRKGDQSKVREKLSKAVEIFKECGADGWVEKYERELAAIS
jgi:tetratricopeptide (TPR) repeat protein